MKLIFKQEAKIKQWKKKASETNGACLHGLTCIPHAKVQVGQDPDLPGKGKEKRCDWTEGRWGWKHEPSGCGETEGKEC